MSHLNFDSRLVPTSVTRNQIETTSLHQEYKKYIIKNYVDISTKEDNNGKKIPRVDRKLIGSYQKEKPLVGIIGGGFAGIYAGLILQSLGIEFEIFESSDRVGGRIYTWYSSDYDANNSKTAGLYGEVGGMRVPQFANDMLAVQHLALSVNAVLKRNNLADQSIIWRRFFYDSPEQRLRYNTMSQPVTKEEVEKNNLTLRFDKNSHGDVPNVWFEKRFVKSGKGNTAYVPIDVILDVICDPIFAELNKENPDFEKLFNKLDKCSMWDYLTTVLKLEDLKKYDASGKEVIVNYYFAGLGMPHEHIPFSVASYLETINVGTNMYSSSVMEIILTVYDWNGSKNHYRPNDPEIYMITVDGGMQRLPNACHTVLNLNDRVEIGEGADAQAQVGMKKVNYKQQYTAENLTVDAYFNSTNPPNFKSDIMGNLHPQKCLEKASTNKQRVYLQHKVVGLDYHESYCGTQRGIRMNIKDIQNDEEFMKEYPYVIATLPFGDYLSGSLYSSLLPFDHLSFEKKRAIRECTYMPSFKAFLVFKEQFWYRFGKRYAQGLGVASTDRSGRQVVYPSYGYPDDNSGKDKPGVLQIYCWSQDARQLGALSDRERINECLKTIQYLYPEVAITEVFAGYDDGKNSKTWFWDEHAGGGAFSFYSPGQFSNIYPILTTSECEGTLNFAGEACSLRHGWIVGALNSAYNSVMNILKVDNNQDLITKMKQIWGDENFHT